VDFIERAFGVAPDGGNGLLELAVCLVPLLVAFLAWLRSDRFSVVTRPTNRWNG